MIRNGRTEDDLRLAHLLADAADAISGPAFVPGGSIEHRLKDDGTPVCATDRAIEDGEPVLGVCSSPAQGRRWWAIRGGGAWTTVGGMSGADAATRLEVAATPAVPPRANAELAWDGHPSRPTVDRLSGKVRWLTMTTHPGLMVADGDLDIAVHPAGGPWDFAAVMLIVREAGGRCVDLSGAAVHLPRPPVIYLGGVDPQQLDRLLGR